MTALLLAVLALDAAVWVIAYALQPAPTASGTLRVIERNTRIIGANVAVASVNVLLAAAALCVRLVLP